MNTKCKTETISGIPYTKELARVEDVRLEIEDHGILTIMVSLDIEDGLHQGFGGYSLDTYNEEFERREGTAAGMDFILHLLRIFGVSRLEDIKGKMVYALYRPDNTLIKGLQTLDMDGGETFTIKDWVERWGLED